MTHLRGWSRRKCKVSLIRDSFGNNFEMIHLRDWVNFRDLTTRKELTSKIVDYHVDRMHMNEAQCEEVEMTYKIGCDNGCHKNSELVRRPMTYKSGISSQNQEDHDQDDWICLLEGNHRLIR